MIDEFIEKILKAEQEADLFVSEAKNQANQIATSTNSEIEAMEKNYADEIKREIDIRTSAAKIEADKRAGEILDASKAEAERIKTNAQKNTADATKTVVEATLKGRH